MTDIKPIKYVVGIDFGTTTSGASIAHVDDPFNIITVLSWEDSNANVKKDPKKPAKKLHSQKFISSILYPNDDNDHPQCGIESLDVGGRGVYIDKIGQYLVDINASNEELGQKMNGLTIEKVVTDYLKYFVQRALEKLQKHEKLVENKKYFADFVSEEFSYEEINSIHYCIACPTDRQKFMKDRFIEARIIDEAEAEHRLSFITEAVAIAHFQLSRDRNKTEIQNDQDYLVCNVGDISTGLAKIHAASTESLSTVMELSEDLAQGSINLETKFKSYLIENMTELNLNISLIENFVDRFSEEVKFAFNMDAPEQVAISHEDVNGNLINFTYEDLNRIVFEPFIESIAEFILNADESHGQCTLFLSGKYGSDEHFIKNVTSKDKGKLYYHHRNIEYSLDMVSSGAVSSNINACKSQIPFIGAERDDAKTILDEPINKTNGNDGYHFIVGIDFGTTFSGCSYVQLKDNKGNSLTTEKIKTIKESWPGGNVNKFGKTPTLLMYDKMKPKYWGEEARLQAKRHKDLNLLGNFKLFLCPESLEKFYGQNQDLEKIKEQGGFTENKASKNDVLAVDVIADYLKLFKNHVIEHIVSKEMNESFGFFTRAKLLKKYKIRYAITVPAMWNPSARDSMVHAAIKATLIKENEVNQLLIISEPEAAALYCEKRFTEYFSSTEGDINDTNFIVLDAGGGTVDLVTFNLEVKKKQEGEKITKESMICQIGDGVGDTCGSTYLDVKFKEYLYEFYHNFGVNIDTDNVQLDEVMQDFIKNQKPNFMPNPVSDSFYDINLPGKSVINFSGDTKYRMANGNKTLRMRNEDMQNIVFDPIVKRIFDLIKDQLDQAEKGKREIKAILMVGGFSQSNYLQRCIKDQYKNTCLVSVPFEGVTAISHGAVSYALNPRMISRKTAGQSLGLEVQAMFKKESTDTIRRKVKGPDGIENFEKDRLEYFVEKNQALEGERRTVYKKDVFVVYPNAAVIAIFSCDSKENANSRYVTNSHVKIVEAKVVMPYVDKLDGEKINFTVSLQVEHIGVSVTIVCKNDKINREVRRITNNQESALIIKPKCNLNVANSKQPLISYSLARTGYLFNIREPSK